jgi:hypothetical protein
LVVERWKHAPMRAASTPDSTSAAHFHASFYALKRKLERFPAENSAPTDSMDAWNHAFSIRTVPFEDANERVPHG